MKDEERETYKEDMQRKWKKEETGRERIREKRRKQI